MNKFFAILLAVMAWVFLAAALIVLIKFLTLNNGEMSEIGFPMIAAALVSCFFAGASWTLKSVLAYTSRKLESEEDNYSEE